MRAFSADIPRVTPTLPVPNTGGAWRERTALRVDLGKTTAEGAFDAELTTEPLPHGTEPAARGLSVAGALVLTLVAAWLFFCGAVTPALGAMALAGGMVAGGVWMAPGRVTGMLGHR
jgi:hypothetical protein